MASSKFKIIYRKKLQTLWSKVLFRIFSFFGGGVNGSGNGGGSAAAQVATQSRLDKKLVLSLSKSRIPGPAQLKYIKKFLNRRELWLVRICLAVIVLSSAWAGAQYYYSHLEIVPVEGGEYSEALVGQPKYINPLYSEISDVDQTISRLVYSSLFKRDKNGALTKDLVENYEVGEDGKIYRLTVRSGVKWHDTKSLSEDLSADDIIFTFNAIKDGRYKSPLRTSFTGVEIEKVDQKKLNFVLSEPYAAFLELLTFGIMPANLWFRLPPESFGLAELNLKPIGSGLYRFDALTRDEAGKIIEYSLLPNKNYYETIPLVNMRYKFYPNAEEAITALNENRVGGISYLPLELEESIVMPNALNFYKLRLPQMNALFFNQSSNTKLADKGVRQALAMAIDKNRIIEEIFNGDAYAVEGPILPDSFAYSQTAKKYGYNREEALKSLNNAGWQLSEITAENVAEASALIAGSAAESEGGREPDEAGKMALAEAEIVLRLGMGRWQKKDGSYLTVKLTSVDKNENARVLATIQNFWRAVGVKTDTELLPANRIQAEIIKLKRFEVLFYGQVVGADPDPYAFWHSSQTKEGGFNLAGYNNKEVDRLLEDARMTSDPQLRAEKYGKFQEIMAEELPAIFLYSQLYTYAQDKKIKNFDVGNILFPCDRFANVAEWYIKTGKKLIWKNN